MIVDTDVKDSKVRVRVTGSIIDIKNSTKVFNEISKFIEDKFEDVVLDLTSSAAISPSFCGFLTSMSGKANKNNVNFRICIYPESVIQELIEITKVDKILKIEYKPCNPVE